MNTANTTPAPLNAEQAQDTIVEANRQLLLDRSRVGIEKYGVTLDASGLSGAQFAQHALEEALDLANYLQGFIQRTQQATASHGESLFDAEFLSKRLARVAKLVGAHIPEHFTHEQVAEVAGTILGDIARLLEARAAIGSASTTVPAWRDALRWSGANTDYHGLVAFTPGQLEHFVSMVVGGWLPKQATTTSPAGVASSSKAERKSMLYEAAKLLLDRYDEMRNMKGAPSATEFELLRHAIAHDDAGHDRAPATSTATPASDTRAAVPNGFVLMPKRLTAENGAKGALSGEFKESICVTCPECAGSGEIDDEVDCGQCDGEGTVEQLVTVGWDNIKDIYKRAVSLLAAPTAATAEAEADAKDAAKAVYWFNCLQKCARMLDLADDESIPSNVVMAVERLTQQPRNSAKESA